MSVEVKFKAELEELLTGMQEAGSVTAEAAATIRKEMLGVHESSKEAGSAIEEMTEHLGKMRQEARLTGFISRQIDSIGLAGTGAGQAIGGLFSSFAIGGGIGVAVEGVKLLVEAVHSIGEEAHKQEEAMAKAAGNIAKSIDKALKAVREGLEPKSKTQGAWEQEVDKAREALDKLDEKINKLVAKKGGFVDAMGSMWKSVKETAILEATGEDKALESSLDRQIRELQEQKEAILATLESKHGAKEGTREAERGADAEKENEIAEKEAKAHELKMLQLKAEGLTGNERLEADYVAKIAAIEASKDLNLIQKEEQTDAELAGYKRKLYEFQASEAEKWNATESKWINANIKAEYGASEALKKYFEQQDSDKLKRFLETQKKAEQSLREFERVGKSVGTGIGSALAGIITGTQSVAGAFSAMATQAMKAVVEMAVTAVEAYAVSSAGAAYFSQVGIPVIGPVLAVAAAAAAGALVIGLLSSIPKASGGYDIPTGVNPVVQAHGGEMILPRPLADSIRAMTAGGATAAGGGGITLNFNGPSDRAWWMSQQDHILRVIGDAVRRNR